MDRMSDVTRHIIISQDHQSIPSEKSREDIITTCCSRMMDVLKGFRVVVMACKRWIGSRYNRMSDVTSYSEYITGYINFNYNFEIPSEKSREDMMDASERYRMNHHRAPMKFFFAFITL